MHLESLATRQQDREKTKALTNESTTTRAEKAKQTTRRNRMSLHIEQSATADQPSMLMRAIWDILKGNARCRSTLQERTFGVLGALHYLRCAYTEHNQVRQMLKYKLRGDLEEDYKIRTEHIVSCMRERQTKRVQERIDNQMKEVASLEALNQERT